MIIAQKIYSPVHHTMRNWSDFSGILPDELVRLEANSLVALQNRLRVKQEEYQELLRVFAITAQKYRTSTIFPSYGDPILDNLLVYIK
jgi:hypothetical protein